MPNNNHSLHIQTSRFNMLNVEQPNILFNVCGSSVNEQYMANDFNSIEKYLYQRPRSRMLC